MLWLSIVALIVSSVSGDAIPYSQKGDTKIIHGTNAEPGQFPYIASLKNSTGSHKCGASILNPFWVLTAAHCCVTNELTDVYVGSIYLSQEGQLYPIKRFVPHPEYNPEGFWANDICLVNLMIPLNLNENVQEVTLTPKGLVIDSGIALKVAGWGTTADGASPDQLQVLDFNIALSKEECSQKLGGMPISDGQLCADAGFDRDVCSGDSGSPVVVGNDILVGIISWSIHPCASGAPNVATRVAQYIDFIDDNINS